jgi:predicted nucleotidyltransferase
LTVVGDLCSRHGYPAALRSILDEVVAAARAEIPGLRAIVLSGSVATGDFVWRDVGGAVRLLSDIDVFVFAGRSGPHASFSQVLRELERRHPSPLFEIDVSISGASTLRHLPERYQFVEARLAAVAPVGEEVLALFPERFDPRAARQSFFGNVRKGVLNWPEMAASDDELYRLALARMILDLPILAFSESGRCIPGHAARAEAFRELPDQHPLAQPDLVRAVNCALRMRQWGDVSREGLEADALRVIDALFDFLDGAGPVGEADALLARRIGRLLPPRPLRRLAGEFRAAVLTPRLLLRDPLWWLRRKEAAGGAALLGLFRFALTGANGSPPPGIAPLLQAWSGGESTEGVGEAFLADARRVYRAGHRRLFPAAAHKPG